MPLCGPMSHVCEVSIHRKMQYIKADKKAAGHDNVKETRMSDVQQQQGFIGKASKDYYGGSLMIFIGLGAAIQGVTYKVGALTEMGPGFFPVALGSLLVLVGLIILAGANGAKRAMPHGGEEALPPEWKGWICISLSIVAFIVLGKYGGLIPATFAVVFISALGDRQNTYKNALILALAMVVVCVIVFSWALKLQFPLFQWD
jgi:hypothetical protein